MLKKHPLNLKITIICMALVAFAVTKIFGSAAQNSGLHLDLALASAQNQEAKYSSQLAIAPAMESGTFQIFAEVVEETEFENQHKKSVLSLHFLLMAQDFLARNFLEINLPLTLQNVYENGLRTPAYIDFCSLKIPF